MRCQDVDRLISDYSVGNLPRKTHAAVKDHVEGCPQCSEELARIDRVMTAVVDGMHEIEPPQGLWNGVYHQIQSKQADPRPVRVSDWFIGQKRALSLGLSAAALAAGLFFGLQIHQPHQQVASVDPAAMEYVQDHAASASQDAFADKVSIGFVANIEGSGGSH